MRYIRTRADTTDMRLLRVSKDAIGTVIAFLTATAAQQSVVLSASETRTALEARVACGAVRSR